MAVKPSVKFDKTAKYDGPGVFVKPGLMRSISVIGESGFLRGRYAGARLTGRELVQTAVAQEANAVTIP